LSERLDATWKIENATCDTAKFSAKFVQFCLLLKNNELASLSLYGKLAMFFELDFAEL
jgi:hypothetical protein